MEQPIITSTPKGMTGFLITRGLARDERGANLILMGIAILMFAVAALAPLIAAPHRPKVSPEEMRAMEQETHPLPSGQPGLLKP